MSDIWVYAQISLGPDHTCLHHTRILCNIKKALNSYFYYSSLIIGKMLYFLGSSPADNIIYTSFKKCVSFSESLLMKWKKTLYVTVTMATVGWKAKKYM